MNSYTKGKLILLFANCIKVANDMSHHLMLLVGQVMFTTSQIGVLVLKT